MYSSLLNFFTISSLPLHQEGCRTLPFFQSVCILNRNHCDALGLPSTAPFSQFISSLPSRLRFFSYYFNYTLESCFAFVFLSFSTSETPTQTNSSIYLHVYTPELPTTIDIANQLQTYPSNSVTFVSSLPILSKDFQIVST